MVTREMAWVVDFCAEMPVIGVEEVKVLGIGRVVQ